MGVSVAEGFVPSIQEWAQLAACRGQLPPDWYVVDESDPDETRETPQRYARAKAFCDVCPVESECLEYALAHRECCGMWGGKTRSERQRIVRKRRKLAKQARIEFEQTAPGVFVIT